MQNTATTINPPRHISYYIEGLKAFYLDLQTLALREKNFTKKGDVDLSKKT